MSYGPVQADQYRLSTRSVIATVQAGAIGKAFVVELVAHKTAQGRPEPVRDHTVKKHIAIRVCWDCSGDQIDSSRLRVTGTDSGAPKSGNVPESGARNDIVICPRVYISA